MKTVASQISDLLNASGFSKFVVTPEEAFQKVYLEFSSEIPAQYAMAVIIDKGYSAQFIGEKTITVKF